jgi:hypothetical protein
LRYACDGGHRPVRAATLPPIDQRNNAADVAEREHAGGRVVTYNHWPLYTYVGDLTPGQATGQALDLNGAPWYVLRPSGAPLLSTGTMP